MIFVFGNVVGKSINLINDDDDCCLASLYPQKLMKFFFEFERLYAQDSTHTYIYVYLYLGGILCILGGKTAYDGKRQSSKFINIKAKRHTQFLTIHMWM